MHSSVPFITTFNECLRKVDIVAEKNNLFIFVEVKTRQSSYLSDPEHTVSMKKQKQVIKAADAYVKEQDRDLESRFDIITVIVIFCFIERGNT